MMKNDARGYSYAMVIAIRNADPNLPGVQLGLFCVEHNIPATKVAKDLGVARHSVYSWFTGRFKPRSSMETQIKVLLERYRTVGVV